MTLVFYMPVPPAHLQQLLVTGVVLTSDGKLSLGHAVKRQGRSLVHRVESLEPEERRKLAGMLAYFKSVEPDLLIDLF